jgi:hypothetical protein
MALRVTARKNAAWLVICKTPDVCKTPIGGATPPVPYASFCRLVESVRTVASVHFNGDPVVVYDSTYVPRTIGDSPGKAKGVKSGTVEGKCWPLEHSQSVRAGTCFIVRDGDEFWINGA